MKPQKIQKQKEILTFQNKNMKKSSKILLLISFFCLLIVPLRSYGSTVFDEGLYAEKINQYDVAIEIAKDSSILITETIDYDFGDLERHGIYRFIPYKYKARGGNFSLRISDLKVVDENDRSYMFDEYTEGNNYNVKIGDPNKYITGEHRYVISYKVERALNYFEDWDELYWNITGDEWEIPILSASATVTMPVSINESDTEYKCFTGIYGSDDEDCTMKLISDNQIEYTSDVEFDAYEGMTIVLGWSKNVVSEPSNSQKVAWIIWDNISLMIAPLVFIFVFLYWWIKGRDPKMKGAVVAEYEAPDDLSPIELAILRKDRFSNKYISAQLVHLAIQGYLKIKQTGQGRKDYQFIYRKDYRDLQNNYDKKIMEYLFNGKKEVEMKDLEYKFYKHIGEIKKLIYDKLTEKKYYAKNPQRARFGAMFIIGIVMLFLSFILGPVFTSFMLGASLFVSAMIMVIFSIFMSKKTRFGTETLRKILGFKEFLKVTEEERLKFHNPPEMVPEIFEKYLPYAMVLDVESKWAKNFEKIYTQQPDWYEGHQAGVWNAVYLANSLSTFSSYSSTVMAAAPSSSSSGGSGFSGGGSGGGGGGGGGGSW